MNNNEYDGPRLIRREDLPSGREVLKLCFGSDFNDGNDEDYVPPERGGWAVMLPKSGPRQGKVVSQIGMDHHIVEIEGGWLQIGSIGGVSTHPDYRNLGLAGRLLEYCAHKLCQEGARLLLISGGRGLYTRTGNVPAMCFDEFILKSSPSQQAKSRGNITVRILTEADAAACVQLHHSDPVHYRRKAENYHHEFYPGGSWMVEVDGKPAAYLLMRLPWEFMDSPGCDIRQVVEYSGDREALAEGIRLMLSGGSELFNSFGIHELWMATPWQDAQFQGRLAEFETQKTTQTLEGHTMRLINFPALRGDLEAYIASRLPTDLQRDLHFEQFGPLQENPERTETEGRCAIRSGMERLELSTAEMTRLVMGSPEQPPGAGYPGIPIDGALSRIVPALFPLLSFLPGLNYR